MSRLIPLAVLLAVGCTDLLSSVEEPPAEAEILEFVTTGVLEFDQDTVRLDLGDRLFVKPPDRYVQGALYYDWQPPPGATVATYLDLYPRVFRCTDVNPDIDGWKQGWPLHPLPCVRVFDHVLNNAPNDDTWIEIKVKLDGWKEPWPEPFAGYARIEVEVGCRSPWPPVEQAGSPTPSSGCRLRSSCWRRCRTSGASMSPSAAGFIGGGIAGFGTACSANGSTTMRRSETGTRGRHSDREDCGSCPRGR